MTTKNGHSKRNFEQVTTEDIEALIKWERDELKNSASTINHHLSYLSVVNNYALKRVPPITKTRMPIERVPQPRVEKWWLRPEDLKKALAWLEDNRDPLFADYIQVLCFQGLRPEEALKLTVRSFTGLDGDEPWIILGANTAGRKTDNSSNSIALFDIAVPVVRRAIERAEAHKWDLLFPLSQSQARDRWNDVREVLGVSDVSSATLRALRRTFAYYANLSGMPTRTLQKVLRHSTITTTEGYLTLVGTDEVGQARGFMKAVPSPDHLTQSTQMTPSVPSGGNDIKDMIAAFRDTGATPTEVAQFVKELMRT